jgi:hypothetical protein
MTYNVDGILMMRPHVAFCWRMKPALSDGTHIDPINALMKAQRKLARL